MMGGGRQHENPTLIYGEIKGDQMEVVCGNDGTDIYIEISGTRIAVYLGDHKWMSLEPGWKAESSPHHNELTVSYSNPTWQRRCS